MPLTDPAASQETSPAPVEIRREAAITIPEALAIAVAEAFPIGKSTLQRWSKTWGALGAASPVKSVLVTTRTGAAYRVDRDDFTAWIIEQKQNMRPGEMLRDPVISQETLRGPEMSRETSQDPERHREAPRDPSVSQGTSRDRTRSYLNGAEQNDQDSSLRDENMQLKIDVEVRKQLLNQAAGEINRQRDHIEKLLRENGGLQSQVLQLSAPATPQHATLMAPHIMHDTTHEEGSPMDHANGDNQSFVTADTVQ